MTAKNPIIGIIGIFGIFIPILYWILYDVKQLWKSRDRSNSIYNRIDQLQLINHKSSQQLQHSTSKSIKINNALLQPLLDTSNIITWFGSIILFYLFTRSSVLVLDYKRKFKYYGDNSDDIFELTLRSFIIYILGNIDHRFRSIQSRNKFIMYTFYFLSMYTITFQNAPDLSFNADQKVSVSIILIMIPSVSLALYAIIRNSISQIFSPSKKVAQLFRGTTVAFVVYHALSFAFASDDNTKFHIHHHYWGFVMALFCRSSGDVSMILQTFALCVFIHGIAVFGCESLFQWEEPDHLEFKNICHEWNCPQWKCVVK